MLDALPQEWAVEIPAHAEAVARFAAAARAVPAATWQRSLAPGKWSPAEITAHVAEVYTVLRREIAGGAGMQLRGSAFSRWLLRHAVLPRLLKGRPFPPGVRAPAETRPSVIVADQGVAVTEFERAAEEFAADLARRQAAGPVWLTHAYFGRGPALYGVRMVTVHLRHHTKQLTPAVSGTVASRPS